MRRWVLAGVAGACSVASAGATIAWAQSPSVVTTGPAGNPIRDGNPRFVITAVGFAANQLPLQFRLQVSLSADFAGPFWADTTVPGPNASITIPRLLPEKAQIWWRTVARTAQGALVAENATGPRQTSEWVALLFPNNVNGNTLNTTRPTFSWTAVTLHAPVAPWRFVLEVRRKADGFVERHYETFATSVEEPDDLESNTSYFWTLDAIAGTQDSVRLTSLASFVILSSNAPIATVLFQPFPNPFPNDRLAATCVWFDLRRQSDVKLDVIDLRGNHVRRILPGSGFSTFPPGRYGRDVFGGDTGCDSRFRWDGTSDAGRTVPPGVYLVRFRADGTETIKKVLFRGR